MVERTIDELIEAGWYVLESDFDPRAFVQWKLRALECVECLMGADHPYTQYFNSFVTRPASTDLLAGEGILNAMKEQVGGTTLNDSLCQDPCIVDHLLPSGGAAV